METKLILRQEGMEWVPISEKVPEEKKTVLVYNEFHDEIVTAYKDGFWWQYTGRANSFESTYTSEFHRENGEITYWMPLPNNPYMLTKNCTRPKQPGA
jgi:hypothetical protein